MEKQYKIWRFKCGEYLKTHFIFEVYLAFAIIDNKNSISEHKYRKTTGELC